MSVDSWKSLFDTVAVVTALLTFIAGAGALWTGNILNKRQAEQLRQFDKDLRDKDLKIANLLALIQPRYLTDEQKGELSDGLRQFSGYAFLIESVRYDAEAALLAKQLKALFNRQQIGLGSDSVDRIGAYPGVHTGALFGGQTLYPSEIRIGIELWTSNPTTTTTLEHAFTSLGLAASTPNQSEWPFEGIPAGRFIAIFVGAKPIPDAKQ